MDTSHEHDMPAEAVVEDQDICPIAACPFCCKTFSTDSGLLAHIKTQQCSFQLKKKKKEDPLAIVSTLVKRMEHLERLVEAFSQRIEVMSRNEVILMDRLLNSQKEVPEAKKTHHSVTPEHTPSSAFPTQGQCVPYDRCSILHINTMDLVKCVKEYEFSGIMRMAKMIYFSPSAPKNKSIIITKGRPTSIFICTDEGHWDAHSKNSALKRLSRQVLNYMSAKLDDEDLQTEMNLAFGVPRAKLEQVISDIDECINDSTGKTHKKFYDDLWNMMMSMA